jgi:hypothetical protein
LARARPWGARAADLRTGAYRHWATTSGAWPDGWLSEVPVLRERRGTAPATVAALKAGEPGTRQQPSTTSGGGHALLRALPVAALGSDPAYLHELGADIAAQTHGSPVGYVTSAELAVIAPCALREPDLASAASTALRVIAAVYPSSHHLDVFSAAVSTGQSRPCQRRLAHFAGNEGASACVAAALYAACSHPGADQVAEALEFAAQAPAGKIVAAVTGALHDADALPVPVLSRCELVWVADTLARDLHAVLTESPDGHETRVLTDAHALMVGAADGSEPGMGHRYPGW